MPTYPADYTVGGPELQPTVLYHYSGWEGVHNILRTSSLRMAHSQFLNDKREMIEGATLIQRVLDEAMVSHNDDVGRLWDAARKGWQADFSDVNVFLASFCEQGDVLEQWRGYAPGGGAAIGFSAEKLRAEADKQNLWLMDCIYLDHLKAERVFRFVDQTNKAIVDAVTEDGERFSDYVCGELMVEVPRYKDAAFVSEREQRLFVYDNTLDEGEDVGFFVDRRGIVPYRNFSFQKDIIAEIILDPRSDNAALFGMREFLNSLGYDDAVVRKSKVPLRF